MPAEEALGIRWISNDSDFRAVAELRKPQQGGGPAACRAAALSRHIKLLEHELRVELFVRNGRGMLVTSAGRMLLDRTTGLMRQIEQVRDDLQSANGNPSGGVILGLVPTVSAVFAGMFARRVIHGFPDISLRIVENSGGHLIEWLHRGEMDLADHLWTGGGSASSGSIDRTRGHRRGGAAGVGAEQEEAGRPEMAGEAETDPSQHLAWPARTAGEGPSPASD